ncbi:16S rRNA (guanine(527)-N(7))-methyltransferase RsmG [Paenibacillus agricola]|uniref:Ribosomal RNA small subunit methyltransferase G n=1 Tax=Paenibacillus agricola TaxID=2716264 RepID=A0ABX0J8H5_9BACL|nr:16S rRNA (guanine(527)-N(7))-methyltransferase RsmG [Paenibacillus agricola]NHN32273.1 16S rRNA (guanine(527)-N(7))-methyltransferase RsmG [Paenibacillus agricola]
MDEIQANFKTQMSLKNIELTDHQLVQFETYYKELLAWNEKMNLTGITDREEVYVKHFFDSLSISFFVSLRDIKNIADIGSGAGFPSIPLKIIFPHLKVTIVDSLNKRIQFLNHLVQELHLTDVKCVHGRAEDIARLPEHRDNYDLVTARAVAKLVVLNELCLPFTAVGGTFVAMKGSDIQEELDTCAYSLNELRSKYIYTRNFHLPDVDKSTRNLIFLRKFSPTPKAYPRKAGTPLKTPLML